MQLADRISRLGTEEAFAVLARAQAAEREGRDMIHMEIGDTDFNTPAPICEAAITAIRNSKTKYLPSAGLHELRVGLAEKLAKSRGVAVSPDEVVITPGGKPVIFYTIMATVNEGDEVIYPNPGFPTYGSVINFVGAKPMPLHMRGDQGFNFNIDELRKLASKNTKLIIVNSPQNPTGGVLTQESLEAIAEVAIENDAWVLADEVYSQLVFDGEFKSLLSIPGMRERTIVLDAYTKSYSMSGWRVGYALCPNPGVAKVITNLINNSVSCTPNFTQWGALQALNNPEVDQTVADMREELKKRRDVLYAGLENLEGLSCHLPSAAIYLFPDISGTGHTSQEVYEFAFNKANVAILPGTSFGQYGEGYVRFSFANNNVERIQEAIQRLEKVWPELIG